MSNAPEHWKKARAYLSKHDPVLRTIIKSYRGEMPLKRGDAFRTLARAIAGQQISVKAADSIWKRIEQKLGKITPKNMGSAMAEDLRACGLSGSKVIYLHALASHFLENKSLTKRWQKMEDDAIVKDLVSVKGVGRWTVEMFLIFHLGRPDVFPIADMGLQKAVSRHYFDGKRITPSQLREFGERWKPYRSVATWYFWRSLDPIPVEY